MYRLACDFPMHVYCHNLLIFLIVVTFQTLLFGVSNCLQWIAEDIHNKLTIVTREVVRYIQQQCSCQFNMEDVSMERFKCFRDSPHYVTYRSHINSTALQYSNLTSILNNWPMKKHSVIIQGMELEVDDTCPTIIESLDVEECSVKAPISLSLAAFAGGLSAIIVVALTLLIMVLVCSALVFSKYKISTQM